MPAVASVCHASDVLVVPVAASRCASCQRARLHLAAWVLAAAKSMGVDVDVLVSLQPRVPRDPLQVGRDTRRREVEEARPDGLGAGLNLSQRAALQAL